VDKVGAPVERYLWELVFATGWTLEYVEALSIEKLHEYLNVVDGMAHVKSSIL